MVFQTPTSMTQLHLAAFSVYGKTNINIVATFTDNTTQQLVTNYTISDWFNVGSIVHTLNGRAIYSSGTIYNLNSGNPRIYIYTFFNFSTGAFSGNQEYFVRMD